MDIVERLIVYRDRPGRSRDGRELLAEACNEIDRLRAANKDYPAIVSDWFTLAPRYRTKDQLVAMLVEALCRVIK